jgi:hypothetical protein
MMTDLAKHLFDTACAMNQSAARKIRAEPPLIIALESALGELDAALSLSPYAATRAIELTDHVRIGRDLILSVTK